MTLKRKRDADLLSRMEREQEQLDFFTQSQMHQEALSMQALFRQSMDRQHQYKQERLLAEIRANAEGIMELELRAAAREHQERLERRGDAGAEALEDGNGYYRV